MDAKTFKARLGLIVLGAAVLALLTLLIPTPREQEWLSFHLSALIPVFNLGIFVPGVFLFLTALSTFKKRVRVAFTFISVGFLLGALGTVQYPIITLLNLDDSAWITQGYSEILFVLGIVCMFLGAWLYTRLVGAAKAWLLLLAMIGGTLVLTLLAASLPHVAIDMPEADVDLLLSLYTLEGALLLAGAFLILLVKRRSGFTYTPAMAWLFIAFFVEALGCFSIVAATAGMGPASWFFSSNVFWVPFILSGLAWLKSAEAFHNITAGELLVGVEGTGDQGFFGQPQQLSDRAPECTDVILFVASLCSDSTRIDGYLDDMRVVTARLSSTESFTAAEQEKLAGVYLDIESYLVERDPVRKFSRPVLRQFTIKRYRKLVDAPSFWAKIETSA